MFQTPQTKLLVLILKQSPRSASSAKQEWQRRTLAPSTPTCVSTESGSQPPWVFRCLLQYFHAGSVSLSLSPGLATSRVLAKLPPPFLLLWTQH